MQSIRRYRISLRVALLAGTSAAYFPIFAGPPLQLPIASEGTLLSHRTNEDDRPETLNSNSDLDAATRPTNQVTSFRCFAPEDGSPPSPNDGPAPEAQQLLHRDLASRPNPLRDNKAAETDSMSSAAGKRSSSIDDSVSRDAPRSGDKLKETPAVKSSNRNVDSQVDFKSKVDRQESPEVPQLSKEDIAEQEATLPQEIVEPRLKAKGNSRAPNVADKVAQVDLTRSQRRMKQRIEACLAFYLANPESVVKRSPWALMHAMLPFGVDTQVVAGNRKVSAIGWMCYNGTCRTQQVFDSKSRTLVPNVGDGMQGHEGQFLAMLAQSSIATDYPIQIGSRKYSVADLVRYEMMTCKEKSELTFKLIGLSNYLEPNQSWTANDHKRWSVDKLVREELDQSVIGAACGGTHRLMGLTFAVKVRKSQGLPIDGEYYRAAIFIDDFMKYAWSLQNPDGSFSTNWLEGRANEPDNDRKVQTTGHILEWLIFTTPSDQLESARIHRCIEFLVAQLFDNREHNWAIGPRSHALRALALYDEKVFGVEPGTRHSQLAVLKEQLQIRR